MKPNSLKLTTSSIAKRLLGLGVLLITILPALTKAQLPAFDCGSNGSYGPMNISGNVNLQLPPDGIFHCTTITIAQGATLTFTHNDANTPAYLLATGDVQIQGTVDVNGKASIGVTGGKGGVGGFDGGSGYGTGGAGHGPGGGLPVAAPTSQFWSGGNGSYSTHGINEVNRGPSGNVYGNRLLMPLIGGSGGSGGGGFSASNSGGGGGGGAVLIASNTRISAVGGSWGTIKAEGTALTSTGGGGSGGAVRLIASTVEGTFHVNINAPNGGGSGRFRVDTYRLNATFTRDAPGSIGRFMRVFPPNQGVLRILSAAGTTIGENDNSPVIAHLPASAPRRQVVRVRASGFNAVVPIRVRLTPDSGAAIQVDAEIDNRATNPATADIEVDFPTATETSVMVFTR